MGTHLISGAGSGIGELVARQLADRGEDLLLVARNEQRAADLRSAFPTATTVVADLGSTELETALADENSVLPGQVREMGAIYLDQIATLTEVIVRLANELEAASKTDDQLRRLCTIPGIGPITAGAVAAFAPDLDTFDSGRNFAAWLGLVPRQRSTGGKTRLGSVSKMGQTDIRRLLIVGAMSVIRWVIRKGGSTNRWLAALVARKPKMVAAVALANKMARMIWAMSTRQENYRMA